MGQLRRSWLIVNKVAFELILVPIGRREHNGKAFQVQFALDIAAYLLLENLFCLEEVGLKWQLLSPQVPLFEVFRKSIVLLPQLGL